MGEVHEDICGTRQSAPKMKWLLRRAGFYWPTMMADFLDIIKSVKNVSDLVMFNWCLLRYCIL